MKANSLLCALLFSGTLVGVPMVVQAAESTQESVKSNETRNRELEVGDKAPDQYKRDEAAVKDWQSKGLPAPEKESHWVKMAGRYVLVQTTNGVILAIHSGKK
ncbi:RcnB family protein [Pseudomonas sp. MLB6B]|uniref:RcnB family protein n=1 Tax=unclassified Pseudomonas TaxID=196821 RepID=UPI0025EAD7AE|nr:MULTISPECIES: RcnB family protein [unclassified Pseudomonas]